MPKIIFEDIKINRTSQKKNLSQKNIYSDDISNNNISTKTEIKKIQFNKRISRTPKERKNVRPIRKSVLLFFLLVIFFYGMFWAGNNKHKVDIVLTPKEQIINFNNKNLVAHKDENGQSLEFEIMIISDKKFKKITLIEPSEVSIKSKGSIVLNNEFSTNPQKLLAGTFLSDNEGKTYQINDTITIPGYSQDGDTILPGQVTVEATSFLPGENYNGSPTDFYIISFKDTNKYNKIYGKLKDPFTGGASGLYYVLGDKDKINIENIAKSSLRNDLLNQVKVLFPEEYIIYPEATTFTYTNNDNFVSKTPESEIEIEGHLSVVLFKKESLVKSIIKNSLPDLSKDQVKEINVLDLDKLSFDFTDKNQIISKDTNMISFNVNGGINLIWNPNTEILKQKLLGVKKDQVLPILRQDEGIASASVKIFPPWKKDLPNDLTKIYINFKQ